MRTAQDRFESATEGMRGCGCAHAADRAGDLERRWLRASSDEERLWLVLEAESIAPNDARRNALIWTPGAILAEMRTVRGIVAQLDRDISASQVDDAFKASWRTFVDEYEAFFKDHQGWLDRFWFASYEKTAEYRRRALDWRTKFTNLGGRASAPVDTPPEGPGARVSAYAKWILVGGGAYLAIRAAAYLRQLEASHRPERPAPATRLNLALERAARRPRRTVKP